MGKLPGTTLLIAAVALGGCTAAEPAVVSTSAQATASAAPTPTVTQVEGKLRFRQIARFDKPVAFATRDGDDTLYVAEQSGRLKALKDGRQRTIVDLSEEASTGGERGLLGVAFHPSGDWLYLDWTDDQGDTRVTEWAFDGTKASARREVLRQDQPYANHNGGQLAFGPDGYLYIAFGDGGSGGDPHGNGQKLSTWLGKILRIDPRGGRPYRVPPDNPFAARRGAKPEIWAYGLRNPWRFGFDRQSGDLWIGDVGQDRWEEVDVQRASSKGGENYGWNVYEGTSRYGEGQVRDHAEPAITYPLGEGGNCSVIAGYVYRGTAIPWLRGRFVYGDFCAGWVNTTPASRPGKGSRAGTVRQLSSFGQDNQGELYALSLRGPLYRVEAVS
ncbi:PQQ-dependent sugar dehydrogenase [Nonomuraea sp. NPDC050663]|uniref:PQQ-dependent sugar dehydrogenase n=1 Tax=Nonomuraea sp. NPDC050663 TaxID=3364370 RepID=UPI0037B1B53E